jgi:hypothetical protein
VLRVMWRMLVLAVMVFACGFTMRLAWESLEEPSEAQAQSPAEGDLYDCKDFATSAEAQEQLDARWRLPCRVPDRAGRSLIPIARPEAPGAQEEGARRPWWPRMVGG